jgi:hypothetical protein
MKKVVVVSCLLLVASYSAWAMQPELIGGVRDGLALGVMAESPLSSNVTLRFGAEANTGPQPIILFFGGKFHLSYVGRSPMGLGIGAVAYSGETTDAGIAISLVFNRAFNVNPLFIEAGIDVANKARLQLQVGYKIY